MRNNAASIIGNGVILLLWQLRCHCNPDHDKFSSLSNTTVVAIFPNVCLWRRSLCSNLAGIDPEKLYRATFICQYGLFCCMALVSFRLFCKNLGNLQEFFGQMVYRPPWPKIARTPMDWAEAYSPKERERVLANCFPFCSANSPSACIECLLVHNFP